MLLAGSAELWPVLDHRSVEIKLTALHQQMGADRGRAFRRGCDEGDGVLVPATVRFAIAAPQIHDGVTSCVDAARRAHFAGVPFEVRTKASATFSQPFSTYPHTTVPLVVSNMLCHLSKSIEMNRLRSAAALAARCCRP